VLQQRVAETGDALHLGAVVQLPVGIDRHAVVLDPVLAGDVEILQRQTERIDDSWTGHAAGFERCCSIRSARRGNDRSRHLRVLERRHVRRRRRRRQPEQHLQHPFAALHRRRAIGHRREQQHTALRQQPAARLWQRYAPELGSGDIRDAVVAARRSFTKV
jgi:hypothetical protein